MAVKSDMQGPLTLSGKELAVGEMAPRRALHKEYLGNPRGGIAPLGRYKAILAFTGASGETHGYQDQWLSDGTFRYYGEGQLGHMKMTAGNLAIDSHVQSGSRLFLFDMNSGRSGYVVYKGEFRKVRRGEDIGPDREKRDRRRYFFDLTPVNGRGVESDVDRQILFDEGRDREIRANRVERSRKAVNAAKRLHGVTCQVCRFNFGLIYGRHGEGFIEVHHLEPVAEAARRGQHKINPKTELAVVCSNCHRMIHRGARIVSLAELRTIIDAAGGRVTAPKGAV